MQTRRTRIGADSDAGDADLAIRIGVGCCCVSEKEQDSDMDALSEVHADSSEGRKHEGFARKKDRNDSDLH